MSAYLCEERHFNFLIAAALQWARGSVFHFYNRGSSFELTHDNATERMRMLASENVASLVHRYPNDPEMFDLDLETVEFRPTCLPNLKVADVLKAIACYEYQSCEHPDWKESMAHGFCRCLEGEAIRRVPGWEAAAWGAPDGYLAPSKVTP